MFYVYILYSKSIDRYYVGYTENLELRPQRHNSGWEKYSKRGTPWALVYSESFSSKSEAIGQEREIKSKKSRKYIEYLIKE